MYREPKSAKRLYFDVIPRNVDDYQQFLDGYAAAGRQAAAGQSGLAHPFRRAAEGRHADLVLHAADAGVVVERRERRDAVGLHRPLPAGRDAADPSQAQRAGRIRHPLFPRLRAAGKRNSASRARSSARRCSICATRCRNCRRTSTRRGHPGRGLRDRPARRRSSTRRRRPRTASPASRSTGSTCSTRCCSARRKARASARSSRSTG